MSEPKPPHILVVEDEAIVSLQITKTLRRLGYTTCAAESGEDAIKLVPAEKPDLALMDIMLAGEMDGIQTAAHLSRHHGTPIVYLTANADEGTVNRAKLTEPYGYLLKPFNETRLRGTIDLALQRHAIANRIKAGNAACQPALEALEDAVFTADTGGRLMYMNLAAETLIGSTLDKVRGAELTALFPTLIEDRRAALRNAIAQVVQTGSAVDVAENGMASIIATYSVVPFGPGKESVAGVMLVCRRVATPDAHSPGNTVKAPPPATPAKSSAGSQTIADLLGLPSRAQAEKAIQAAYAHGTHQFAVAFVLDRFDLIRHRFGAPAAHEVLLYYSIHVAQSMGPTDLLFQWTDPSFVMLLERPAAVLEVRREISSWAGVRMEKVVEAGQRSVMLIVSGKWHLFEALTSVAPEKMIRQIDAFIVGATARNVQ